MDSQLTLKEFNGIKCLVQTQNNLIYRLEEYSNKIKEPQLKIDIQKLCASARNHKDKLMSLLKVENK